MQVLISSIFTFSPQGRVGGLNTLLLSQAAALTGIGKKNDDDDELIPINHYY
jgi:hypothetical protein